MSDLSPGNAAVPLLQAIEAILADKRRSHERYVAEQDSLDAKLAALAGAPRGVPPAERVMSKERAAEYLNMPASRMMRYISRYQTDNRDRLPLATQPSGKGGAWNVFVDRIKMVQRGERTDILYSQRNEQIR